MALFVFALTMNAQISHTVTIRGVFLDSLTNEGEPYATLRLVKAESPNDVVKVITTDLNGVFAMPVASTNGEYTLTISSLGKEPVVRPVVIDEKTDTIDLKKIYSRNA